jgi:tetratricopeptide (TPR) repeat protein
LKQVPHLFTSEQIPTFALYVCEYSDRHLKCGQDFFKFTEFDLTVHFCLEAVGRQHGPAPRLMELMEQAYIIRDQQTRSHLNLEKAVSFYRKALELQPFPPPGRPFYDSTFPDRCLVADLEKTISLLRKALEFGPCPRSRRSFLLKCLGAALVDRHRLQGTMTDLEEAISFLREAVELRTSLDPDCSLSLNTLEMQS